MCNLSWQCNYGDCPYCWTSMVVRNTELIKVPDHNWQEWTVALNKLDPAIFDFVGGEPLIFPDFLTLLNNLDKKHYFAVTSNLYSQTIFDFISTVQPTQCIHFTCSYHPTGKLSLNQFATRASLLRNAGFATSINIINHPSIKDQIPEAETCFKQNQLIVKVSPYEHPPDLLTPNKETLTCNGGSNHYVLNNNGDAYRCLSWFRHPNRKEAWIGNIFDGSFKKQEEQQPCQLRCEMYYVVDQANTMIRDLEIKPL